MAGRTSTRGFWSWGDLLTWWWWVLFLYLWLCRKLPRDSGNPRHKGRTCFALQPCRLRACSALLPVCWLSSAVTAAWFSVPLNRILGRAILAACAPAKPHDPVSICVSPGPFSSSRLCQPATRFCCSDERDSPPSTPGTAEPPHDACAGLFTCAIARPCITCPAADCLAPSPHHPHPPTAHELLGAAARNRLGAVGARVHPLSARNNRPQGASLAAERSCGFGQC